ncbi:MAG: AAA family ATPase [Muribaculaceae bacterium]|nr:AAA family ATPase [Muribaculaceae bacterium]
MPLNQQAKAEYNKLSKAARERIDNFMSEARTGVQHSKINKILTSSDWKNVAQKVLGKASVFEIDSFQELQKLFNSDDFYKLMDESGFIKSLFNTHYKDVLKNDRKTGNAQLNKRLQKLFEPKRDRRNNSEQTKTLHPSNLQSHSGSISVNKKVTPPFTNSQINARTKNIADLLHTAYNIILHGAPGTGKTYLAKNIAKAMGCDQTRIKMVQFHPSYDYTDFMEGLRPCKKDSNQSSIIGFERKNGAFKEFCKNAINALEKEKNDAFVFIIDEINRGEISKILGECMFSIDPGYIGEDGRVETQYQNLIDDKTDPFKDGFYRPENVYIIGTMNDIDRGVESMDLAMRRRFQFIEIKTEDTRDDILKSLKDKELETKATERMNALNNVIRETPELGEDYCIGASYFLKVKNFAKDEWENLWSKHLKGLLKEYVRGLEDSKLMEKFEKAYWSGTPANDVYADVVSDGEVATDIAPKDEEN